VQVVDMKNKLLVICGPTSTGKTALALSLAKKFNGEIVSADSRQVYIGMDVGTGKDIPENSKFEIRNPKLGGYYLVDGTKVWGYDLVKPQEDFSVGLYQKITNEIIKFVELNKKLPILIGGTGLYIKAIVDGIETATIPQNQNLRKSFEVKTKEELYEILAQLDPIHAGSLNTSDKKNPRRLIRAIEIATWKIEGKQKKEQLHQNNNDVLFIGLIASKEELEKRMAKRINERINKGIIDEVKKLIKTGIGWEGQAMTSLGYRQWKDFFEGRITQDEVVKKWMMDEVRYAKRQLTWFKRDKRINWFDVTTTQWQVKVEKLVKKWYSSA
jgi:tRNA dimethylallyltransferase